jgi:hypothetical protein
MGSRLHDQELMNMITRTLLCSSAILLSATFAHAQIPCMPNIAAVTEIMGPHYSEYPLFEGTLAAPNQAAVAVTLFANPSTGTWTMVASADGKVSCLILSGKDFRPASTEKVLGKLSSLSIPFPDPAR